MNSVRISHIGSTAVPYICAKTIFDILVEVPKESNLPDYKDLIINSGYLHLRYAEDNDELYFREYLIEQSDVAKEYEELKLKLWKRYEYNRDAYTNAKTEFVNKYTKEARMLYGKF